MKEQSIYLVNLKGNLDSTTAPEFYEFIKSKQQKGYKKFLFNCDSLAWLTSRGISVLVQLQNELQESGCYMVVSGLNGETSRLFSLLGINRHLLIAGSRAEAEKILDRIEMPAPKEKKSEGFQFAPAGLLVEENEIIREEPKKEILSVPVAVAEPEKVVHYSNPASVKNEKSDFAPFAEKIINCESCGSRLKVERTGLHKCPSCQIEFDVRNSGSVSWLEKL